MRARMVAVDSSPLIHLARIRQLDVLNWIWRDALIGLAVHAETVEAGRAIQAPDVRTLEKAITTGWLRVCQLTPAEITAMHDFREQLRLGPGGAESLAVAQARSIRLIVDDKAARNAAGTLGIEHVGTAGVWLEAYIKGGLSAPELENSVRDFATRSRISESVVADILRRARET